MRAGKQPFLIVLAVLLGLFAGCVDNDKSLVIAFAAPLDEDCSPSVQDSDNFNYVPYGLLDLTHPSFGGHPEYYMYPQVHNYLYPTSNPDIGQMEANDIQMRKGVVTYEWLQGRAVVEGNASTASLMLLEDDLVEVVTNLSSAVVGAGDGDEPGQMVNMVRLVTRQVGGQLILLTNLADLELDKVVLGAHVRLVGETLGGRTVTSNDFVFPIEFCVGCLGNDDTACRDPDGNIIYYPGCHPGQDTNANRPCE